MIRFIFSLLLISYSLNLSAQKISWVPFDHKGLLEDNIEIIKSNGDFFLAIDKKKATLKISKHDKQTGKSILTKKIKLRINKKKYRYHSAFWMKGATYLIVSRKKSVYYIDIDPSTLSLSQPQLLFTSKISKETKFTKSMNNETVVFFNIQESGLKREKIELFTFDKKLKPLWQKELTTHLDGYFTATYNIQIDNLGNVFFASYGAKKFSNKNQKVTVHHITDSGNNHQTLPLTIVKPYLVISHILWSPEPGVINFWGFYGIPISRLVVENLASGYFFQQLDFNTSTVHPPKTYPALESQQISPKINKLILKKKKRNNNLYIPPSKIHLLSDTLTHDAIIIMEHHSHSPMWNVGWRDLRLFYSGIIECVRINHTGDLLWEQIINKKQRSETDLNLSYSFFNSNKKLYILFNDLKENPLNRKLKKNITRYTSKYRHKKLKIKRKKSTIITLTTIDFDGHLTEQVIPTKQPIYLLPKFSSDIGNTKGVLLGKVKRKYKLGIFSYD